MAEEIKTITEKANILSRDKAEDLTNVETFEGEKTDGTPVRVPKSLIASAAEVSQLSQKVGDLETDKVDKVTGSSLVPDTKVSNYDSHLTNTSNPHSVTKAQVGLSNVGNFKAVSTEASQGLSDTEKGNARSNMSVYSQDESDDRNLPTGGTYASVDLGIVLDGKSVLFSRTNVGATAETDYGDLFAWGATEPYRTGTDSTGNYSASKANEIQHDLYPNQDAATIHMGTGWRMPTKAELDALMAQCYSVWSSIGGIAGRIFYKAKSDDDKGKRDGNITSGNTYDYSAGDTYVFFPASGTYDGSSVIRRAGGGNYWSRSFGSSSNAWKLYFDSGNQNTNTNNRYYGFAVRGVRA